MKRLWPHRLRDAAPLGVVLLSTGALLWWCGLRGWYPHDEGLLGQSARRVLAGEIPHRDFADPYSGGLALFHAGVFHLFGERLSALRRVFDVVAWGWSALVFGLARRWLPGWGAALATMVAVVWSVPVYPAAMPSWYVLFLVTAALALLVRDEGAFRASALLGAGACLGLAITMKITALFAVAGIFIALGRLRQLGNDRRHASPELLVGAGLFVVVAMMLTLPVESSRVLVHVTLPTVALALAVLAVELRIARAHGIRRDPEFQRHVGLLTVGAAIPLLPFTLWLAGAGGLLPLLHSLSAVAGQRAAFAGMAPPSAVAVLLAVPLLLVLLGVAVPRVRPPLFGAGLIVLFAGAWYRFTIYRDVWQSLRGVLPLGAALLAVEWWRRDPPACTRRPDHVLVTLTCASLALGQFPFASAIYFVYLVPLLVLSVVSIISKETLVQKHIILTAGFLIIFAVAQVLPGTSVSRGFARQPAVTLSPLPGRHGGLRVPEAEALGYSQLLAVIDSVHDTLPIWAGPDAPEVAFLAGRADRNPAFFAFLDRSGHTGLPTGEALTRAGVRTVVIQTKPPFSPAPTDSELLALARWYPESRRVGDFEVRWRAEGP